MTRNTGQVESGSDDVARRLTVKKRKGKFREYELLFLNQYGKGTNSQKS